MSLLDKSKSQLDRSEIDEQRLLIKISNDIGEPVTIRIVDYYPDKKKIRFDFPDNWHIMIDEPNNIENLSDEAVYQSFITQVRYIRADQLKGVENTA